MSESSCEEAHGVRGTRPWPLRKAGREGHKVSLGGHQGSVMERELVRFESSTHLCVGIRGVKNHMTGNEPHNLNVLWKDRQLPFGPSLPAGVKRMRLNLNMPLQSSSENLLPS